MEEFHQGVDAKEIFRRSSFYNTSTWVVPDDKGELKIQLGKERKVKSLWSKVDPLSFSMSGGTEKTVRIEIPPINESDGITLTDVVVKY